MARKTIITCAVTGGAPLGKNPAIPVTPAQIAQSGIEAAKAGAAILHIHVRDPDTGERSMDPALYRETIARIRDSGVDVVINLTTGPGGGYVPSTENPAVAGPGTMFVTPEERVRHVVELRPEICSLDLGTLWLRNYALINPPDHVAEMARLAYEAGVVPELEIFDTGDLILGRDLLDRGALKRPLFYQFALGARYGAPATPAMIDTLRRMIPDDAPWSAFGIGPLANPIVAQSFLMGGHCRVGLEDNLYMDRGVFASSNAQLVERAVQILDLLGGNAATPQEARNILGLREPSNVPPVPVPVSAGSQKGFKP